MFPAIGNAKSWNDRQDALVNLFNKLDTDQSGAIGLEVRAVLAMVLRRTHLCLFVCACIRVRACVRVCDVCVYVCVCCTFVLCMDTSKEFKKLGFVMLQRSVNEGPSSTQLVSLYRQTLVVRVPSASQNDSKYERCQHGERGRLLCGETTDVWRQSEGQSNLFLQKSHKYSSR